MLRGIRRCRHSRRCDLFLALNHGPGGSYFSPSGCSHDGGAIACKPCFCALILVDNLYEWSWIRDPHSDLCLCAWLAVSARSVLGLSGGSLDDVKKLVATWGPSLFIFS